MSYSVDAAISSEMVKIDSTFPIEMFVINASLSGWEPMYYVNLNQDIFGFEMNASGNLVATDSQTYIGLPVQRDIISNSTDGQIAEITISIPNTDRVVESVIQSKEYLRGREVHIITGFAKHLPSGATAKHIGSSPDRFAVMKEKLYVDSTTSDENVVSFSCKPKFVIKNMILPGRLYSRVCAWAFKDKYRETECDPDSNISATTFPHCDGTLDNCRARNNESRFGGFPSIPSRGIVIIS